MKKKADKEDRRIGQLLKQGDSVIKLKRLGEFTTEEVSYGTENSFTVVFTGNGHAAQSSPSKKGVMAEVKRPRRAVH
ncbi:MAG TPA: hypothetical protein VF573_12945 [Paraburkholderia sp.]|uniref:hypothetical protein n=1 Tax=Paraburkholderia sp. TaxID=1926495 RepID=UPI002ED1BA77